MTKQKEWRCRELCVPRLPFPLVVSGANGAEGTAEDAAILLCQALDERDSKLFARVHASRVIEVETAPGEWTQYHVGSTLQQTYEAWNQDKKG